ncbi:hypothetical protein F444_18592 [Phytophthora nicotianae P1976]|uniref:SET domain-containing protein n=1 Tax=Phytophthora nicotianae P1976 TaxID=1317066 RepID=A0A080ZAW2_PHYNI|nr:hypothetical protein F444_18592 [Phytophthora nicotianae P1976]
MSGLSALELPPEALHAGDTVEYFYRAYVCGDRRGYRRAVVTRADGGADVDFPVAVNTGEPISRGMMLKRMADCYGTPTRGDQVAASALNSSLQAAVVAAYEAVCEEGEHVLEEIVPKTPHSSASSSPNSLTYQEPVVPPSTPPRVTTTDSVHAGGSTELDASFPSEGESGLREIIDLVSPGESSGMLSDSDAADYVQAIPNRHARDKIRHQAKKKREQWLVPRSRKRRHLARCANSPEVKLQLAIPRAKRSTYSDPAYKQFYIVQDCSMATGDREDHHLGAFCSNAPRTLSSLKLFDTGRVGLGVYTTTALDVGDVLGEYRGELSEFSHTNSGFTLLYNTKSIKNNYLYVDAQRCGSITSLISHSCEPNAAFVDQQTRSRVRMFVKMIKGVQPGAPITVHYGSERWFKCDCDRCSKEPSGIEESSDGEKKERKLFTTWNRANSGSVRTESLEARTYRPQTSEIRKN